MMLQFQTGLEGLHPRDHHLITWGQDNVLQMTGTGKLAWLSSIQIECEIYMTQMAKEAKSMRKATLCQINSHNFNG
jgi:hypothetical protein